MVRRSLLSYWQHRGHGLRSGCGENRFFAGKGQVMGSRSAILCASVLAVALATTGCKNCWGDDDGGTVTTQQFSPPAQAGATNQRPPQGTQAMGQAGQQPAWNTPPAWNNPPARMTPPPTSMS